MTRILTNFRGKPGTPAPDPKLAAAKRQACSTANRKAPITLPRLPTKEPSNG